MTSLDLFNVSGTIVTWVGLGFTLYYSKKASRLSKEARDAVQGVHLQDALSQSSMRASQLADALNTKRWEYARCCADDLRLQLIRTRTQYKSKVDDVSLVNLKETQNQVGDIRQSVRRPPKSGFSQKAHNDLINLCSEVQHKLEEEMSLATIVQIERK